MTRTQRTCEKGHTFYKSTDCPTCPTCEKENKPKDGFLARLSSPTRRALVHYLQIDSVEKLAQYTEKEILSLHGIGKASLPTLRTILEEEGLQFKPSQKTKK
ncbi:MAG: RNA polymerase alpha subunit C-terminal domain-containing protein [Cryomorphaceae bacterium]|nr:RNA polymerase alpha subunit C-terminal domain-containing protein [Cryomorphaceae bacterium]